MYFENNWSLAVYRRPLPLQLGLSGLANGQEVHGGIVDITSLARRITNVSSLSRLRKKAFRSLLLEFLHLGLSKT